MERMVATAKQIVQDCKKGNPVTQDSSKGFNCGTMIISERIFQKLKEKGMTQKQFAEATGITPSTISDWKHKKTNPAADKIMIICDVLEISPTELLSGAENEKFKSPTYIMLDKNSEEYYVVQQYRKMDSEMRSRLAVYMKALLR